MSDYQFGGEDDYFKALSLVLKEGVPDKQLAILKAHFQASEHTASAQFLADAVGYKAFISANGAYAKLARRISEALGVINKPSEGFWLFVLAKWGSRDPITGDTRFAMRAPLVGALRRLGFDSEKV